MGHFGHFRLPLACLVPPFCVKPAGEGPAGCGHCLVHLCISGLTAGQTEIFCTSASYLWLAPVNSCPMYPNLAPVSAKWVISAFLYLYSPPPAPTAVWCSGEGLWLKGTCSCLYVSSKHLISCRFLLKKYTWSCLKNVTK